MLKQWKLNVILVMTIFSLLLNHIGANVVFHFGLDFSVKDAETNQVEYDGHINKTVEVHDNQISVFDNNNNGEQEAPLTTTRPLSSFEELREEQKLSNVEILKKIEETKVAVKNLNDFLGEFVGNSDLVAQKIKWTTRYLNAVELVEGTPNLEILESFVLLVDELKSVPQNVEFSKFQRVLYQTFLNTSMNRSGLFQLQTEVREFNEKVGRAREAWQRFTKTKLVEVPV